MSASLFILREMDCYWSDKNTPDDIESEHFPIVNKLYGAESLSITGHYFSQFMDTGGYLFIGSGVWTPTWSS